MADSHQVFTILAWVSYLNIHAGEGLTGRVTTGCGLSRCMVTTLDWPTSSDFKVQRRFRDLEKKLKLADEEFEIMTPVGNMHALLTVFPIPIGQTPPQHAVCERINASWIYCHVS